MVGLPPHVPNFNHSVLCSVEPDPGLTAYADHEHIGPTQLVLEHH